MSRNQNGAPLISVIMPVYNAEPYLRQAVDSILNQTYADFELIAINDGSPDNSLSILQEYADNDKRVVILDQKNTGLVGALNNGIALAKGKYIARMDPDDISFPRRFEQQVGVLESKPEVVLVAGGFEVMDEDDEYVYREVLPALSDDLKRSMLLRNPIAHGSAMFRKSTFEQIGEYSSTCGPMEDFYLWTQMAELGEIEAVEATIYKWRINSGGITSTKNKQVLSATKQHINTLWQKDFPRVIKTRELHKKGLYYRATYEKRGVDMKNVVWADNARIAVKMIVRGHPLKGLSQMAALSLTGRAGIKAVLNRILLIIRGTSNAAGRYAGLKKQSNP